MFLDFLEKLKPIHSDDNPEWIEILNEHKEEFNSEEPGLFWYLSSGLDWKALVHFNENDTTETYKTPRVDYFIYSDYNKMLPENMENYYKQLDSGEIILFEDTTRTKIILTQMIPLQYFSNGNIGLLNEKYNNQRHPGVSHNVIIDKAHFYYCSITIESVYFGTEYFPVFVAPIENWVLMDEVWKKHNIAFDYVCGVCDGCRKGGAYKCVNRYYNEFLSVMKQPDRFWISDHINKEIDTNDFNNRFKEIASLKGWGNYNANNNDGTYHSMSYLYKII